jgi:osmoprotectant transport system substrate-binding protein/osmoprotectant transport system permease protein
VLGIWVSADAKKAEAVLAAANVMQTIPSLALLALMVPLLGEIGFAPAFAAMVLYSLAPILSGIVTGFREVDKKQIEAGTGIGMEEGSFAFWSRTPSLRWSVKWPNALPHIISGVKLATVIVVGSATLATPVGDRTLGNYIFIGLNTNDYLQVVFGCVATALLAVVFERLIFLVGLGLQERDKQRRKRLLWGASAGLLVLLAGGLYYPAKRALNPPENELTLGSHDHTEQHILGEVLQERLRAGGVNVRWRQSMGQPMTLQAMFSGKVDVCVEYLGNIWTNVMNEKPGPSREEMLQKVRTYLDREHGVEVFGPVGFQNAYVFAMREDEAQRRGITTVRDLQPHASNLSIGGDMQFFKQAEWKDCKKKYGLNFRDELYMDQGLMYKAVQSGKKVKVIVAYSTDARIGGYKLRTLEDKDNGLPRYDAVFLLSKKARGNAALRQALQPLVESINDARMTGYNRRVDVEEALPGQVARELLADLRLRGQFGPRDRQ